MEEEEKHIEENKPTLKEWVKPEISEMEILTGQVYGSEISPGHPSYQ